ncbi:hypothetical protein [Paenibacillus shenyangensis]|uniref:hypothetical protein n=1 Tax=Paenibacillus sp. A9 TaxID=1284352 RepID=UPI001267D4A6|nr:hypothetical protein [Paenibacillus sp. A9]
MNKWKLHDASGGLFNNLSCNKLYQFQVKAATNQLFPEAKSYNAEAEYFALYGLFYWKLRPKCLALIVRYFAMQKSLFIKHRVLNNKRLTH